MQDENKQLAPTPEYTGAHWLDVPEDELAGTDVGLYSKILIALWKSEPNLKYSVQADQNRDKYYYYACTIHAACWALCDLLGYTYETYLKLVEAVTKRMEADGKFGVTWGAYTAVAMEYTEKVHNEMFPNNKVIRFKTTIGTAMFNTLLNRRYSLVVTYISSKAMTEDAKDGILDGNEFNNYTGWHCVRWTNKEDIKYKTQNCEYITLLNNYFIDKKHPDLGYQHYKIPRSLATWNSNLLELTQQRGWPYYESAYFFLKQSFLDWLKVN